MGEKDWVQVSSTWGKDLPAGDGGKNKEQNPTPAGIYTEESVGKVTWPEVTWWAKNRWWHNQRGSPNKEFWCLCKQVMWPSKIIEMSNKIMSQRRRSCDMVSHLQHPNGFCSVNVWVSAGYFCICSAHFISVVITLNWIRFELLNGVWGNQRFNLHQKWQKKKEKKKKIFSENHKVDDEKGAEEVIKWVRTMQSKK